VFVFAGLTVYDAQRLTLMAREAPAEGLSSYAIVGALALYLDFMNLFPFLPALHREPAAGMKHQTPVA